MRIVDAHAHLGRCRLFCIDVSPEDLLEGMDANGVDASIVQPVPGAVNIEALHEEVADMAAKHKGRIFGLACFDPYLEEDEYGKLATWAVKDLDFRGLKIHTNGHSISPVHPYAKKVFRIANDLKVPVMIHTGPGVPNSMPSLCIPPAMEYPDLPIVLAHAGGELFSGEAVIAANLCPNIYLEGSWTTSFAVPGLVAAADGRLMFGSDVIGNIPTELAKYRSQGLTEGQLENILHNVAEKLFRLGC